MTRWPEKPLVAAGVAALVLAAPYFGFLGTHQLWQPHEPDLVEVAREMRASGDLLVPRLNGAIYAEKPPLYYWSALGAASLRGRLDETAARLPAALSALGLVLATALLGARLLGPRAGLLSGLVAGTTPLVLHYGTAGTCDMPLACATTAALLAFHRAVLEERASGPWLLVAGFFVGLSVLAKSLAGPALLVAGGAPALLLDRERRLPKARWWVLAALAALAVALPWYALVWQREGWGFLRENLLRQTFGRFFTDDEQRGAVYTYLGTVPLDFLPWTFFLPAAFAHARRARAEDPARWRRLRFLLVFVGVDLVFLSLSRCRIHKYALPLFPALALAVAAALDGAKERLERRLALGGALAASGALAVAAVGGPIWARSAMPAIGAPALLAALPLLAGGVVVALVARSGSPRRAGLALGLVLAVAVSHAEHALLAPLDEVRSDKPLQAAIRALVRPDAPFVGYKIGVRAYLIFYTERPYKLVDRSDQLPRLGWILTKEKYVEELRSGRPEMAFETVGRNPPGVGHDDFVLVWTTTPVR